MTLANVAYLDNMQRGEKTRSGMQQKVLKGGFPGMAPIGYVNVPDKSDPEGRRRTVDLDRTRAPLAWISTEGDSPKDLAP